MIQSIKTTVIAGLTRNLLLQFVILTKAKIPIFSGLRVKPAMTNVLLFLLLSSCTAPIDIETNDSPPVVSIYGCFTDELKPQSISVSVSSPYFGSQPNRALSGALVEVNVSNGDVFTLIENPAHSGRYQTENAVAAVAGLTYQLTVKTDIDNDGAQEIYTAVSTMPTAITVDSIRVKNESMMGHESYKLYIYMQDSPAEDYYFGAYEVNGFLFDKISKYTLLSDDRFNGQYLNAWEFGRLGTMEDDEDHIRVKSGDVVTLHFSRIEKGYYDFLHQCRNGMSGESLFSGPAANITSNMLGSSAVGYFTAYVVSKTMVVVE
jgi:hypothetical protein